MKNQRSEAVMPTLSEQHQYAHWNPTAATTNDEGKAESTEDVSNVARKRSKLDTLVDLFGPVRDKDGEYRSSYVDVPTAMGAPGTISDDDKTSGILQSMKAWFHAKRTAPRL